ncbi:ABC transporter permease [Glaciihabitans sp. INWT7]|uniref:ABC transporter permease n=1 Tax=Glaciihabitans sp. INWT7 TaxID=2596912 RepID=UPI0016261025|nr:ABC transporter permease [Glaciihabitans sp. INWT7]QNE47522.1 ABC transporter permease [Glaciihabitans sp. INWT7]
MTTTALFTRVVPTTGTQRIGRIVRLHFANPWGTIVLPWIILGTIFLANLVIWLIVYWSVQGTTNRGDVADGLQYSGSSFYIFVYMLIVAIQAINVTFPFALGYGVTRRDYYLGTAVNFVVLSLIYSTGITVLSIVEELTNGWGVGGCMFTAGYFGGDWPTRFYVFFVALLFFFFVGALFGAIYVRWRASGMVALFIGLGLVGVGIIALLILTDGWSAVGAFFAAAGLVGSVFLSLVVTAIAATAGYVVLRGATPRG